MFKSLRDIRRWMGMSFLSLRISLWEKQTELGLVVAHFFGNVRIT